MKALVWIKNSVKGYCKDEEGQTTIEYIMLLFVVVAIIVKFKSKMSDGLGTMVDDIFDNKIKDIMK